MDLDLEIVWFDFGIYDVCFWRYPATDRQVEKYFSGKGGMTDMKDLSILRGANRELYLLGQA